MSSKAKTIRDEINEVKKTLNLSDDELNLTRLTKYQEILHSIREKFTTLKANKIRNWWWDSFINPYFYFYPKNINHALAFLVPEKESVWFVIDDETKTLEPYWLYEGKIHSIIAVLNELPFCEYYIISKHLDWILCENHHNILIGCGDSMIEKMKTLSEN